MSNVLGRGAIVRLFFFLFFGGFFDVVVVMAECNALLMFLLPLRPALGIDLNLTGLGKYLGT